MGDKNYELGPGTVYFDEGGGHIYTLGEIECTKENALFHVDIAQEEPIQTLNNASEWSAVLDCSPKMYERLAYVWTKIYALSFCKNRRVVYLAKQAKKIRTRKKNLIRAIEIWRRQDD